MANSTSKAGPCRTVFALTLLFGPALFLIFISTRGCEHKFKQLEDFGKIPQYSLLTQAEKNTPTLLSTIRSLFTPRCNRVVRIVAPFLPGTSTSKFTSIYASTRKNWGM